MLSTNPALFTGGRRGYSFIELTDDNVVNVELQGACGSCPFSRMTLKNGVEDAVRKALPEIKSVEAVNL
jgi:Fe-S cluster biogenesis protein NfuA